MDYSNIATKLSHARRKLMLPHTLGVPESISSAFFDASLALDCVEDDNLDEEIQPLINDLRDFLDTSAYEHLDTGRHLAKAKDLKDDELMDFSRLIDELAHRFSAIKYGHQ